LQYFCFLTHISRGATKCTVEAIVGQDALHIKQTGEKIQQDIVELEKKLQSDTFTYELLNTEINHIKHKINDRSSQATLLSYLIREECSIRLENLSKAAWLREKEIEKYITHMSHVFYIRKSSKAK
jgi:seryl-tRNA synthetase